METQVLESSAIDGVQMENQENEKETQVLTNGATDELRKKGSGRETRGLDSIVPTGKHSDDFETQIIGLAADASEGRKDEVCAMENEETQMIGSTSAVSKSDGDDGETRILESISAVSKS